MKSKKIKLLFPVLISVIIALGLSVAIQSLFAWTTPTAVPPSDNVTAPINTSSTGQSKDGGLIINHLGAAANGLIVENGNVGIGTTMPNDTLSIISDDPHINIGFSNTPTGEYAALEFEDTDGVTNRIQFGRTNEDMVLDYNYDGDANGSLVVKNNQNPVMTVTNNGYVGINTETPPTARLDVYSNRIRLRTARPALAQGTNCETGDISWDTNYIYVCVDGSTNDWKRASLATY